MCLNVHPCVRGDKVGDKEAGANGQLEVAKVCSLHPSFKSCHALMKVGADPCLFCCEMHRPVQLPHRQTLQEQHSHFFIASLPQAGQKHAAERPSKKRKSADGASHAKAPVSAAAQAAALLNDLAKAPGS